MGILACEKSSRECLCFSETSVSWSRRVWSKMNSTPHCSRAKNCVADRKSGTVVTLCPWAAYWYSRKHRSALENGVDVEMWCSSHSRRSVLICVLYVLRVEAA